MQVPVHAVLLAVWSYKSMFADANNGEQIVSGSFYKGCI